MSRRRNRFSSDETTAATSSPVEDPIEALIRRSRRCRQRGEHRRALVLLREACALDETRPRTWVLLGARLARLGRYEEASAAFERARWLQARAGEKARAAVTARLAEALRRLAA
ncbi:MAG: hypothetical protein IT372_11495 [Polyangiaceae bacterium]|nr:hypothetical protein [Polyangiaceae bacterium]